jgi:L-asparaginase
MRRGARTRTSGRRTSGTLAQSPGFAHHRSMDRAEAIRVIITGGTFDKHYDEVKGSLGFKETHLPEILAFTRCTVPIELELNQLIDSLEMRTANRLQVLEACRRASERRIVVTHGTDTMVETAQVLGGAALPKTIVLTGAMVPYMVVNSDAVFNFGCAVTAAQLCPRGVWIAMNGRVFRWDAVRKNRERGVFESKEEP